MRHPLDPAHLLVALSTGSMASYVLNLDGQNPQLHLLRTYRQFDSSTLVLSLAMEKTYGGMVATLSTGEVAVINVEKENANTQQSWKAHDMEVWCSAWKTSNVVLTQIMGFTRRDSNSISRFQVVQLTITITLTVQS